jgi:hypothetical protein
MRTPKNLFLLTLLAFQALACYGYYPPQTTNLTQHEVRLVLTDSGSVIMSPKIGQGTEAMDGTLLSETGGVYRLGVVQVVRRDGQFTEWKGEPVDVAAPLVATVEEKRFSRTRTAVFVGASAIALVALKAAFNGPGGATVPGNTPQGPGGAH